MQTEQVQKHKVKHPANKVWKLIVLVDPKDILIEKEKEIPQKNIGYMIRILFRPNGKSFVSKGKAINLTPEVWRKVEKGEIAVSAAIELAKVPEETQIEVAKSEDTTVDTIREMRRKVAIGKLNIGSIEKAMHIPLSGATSVDICPKCGSPKKCKCEAVIP